MMLSEILSPGWLSQVLPTCPLPAVWSKVETTVPSGGLLFDKRERAKSLVEPMLDKRWKVCPTNKVSKLYK